MSHRRKGEENRRLKKLYEETHKHSYSWGGAYYNDNKNRYVRIRTSRSGFPKYVRRLANKRIRQRKMETLNNSRYRKASEYWNTLY